jgi:hypothetical protein
MNGWLDMILVALALLGSVSYVVYALGPKRIKNAYSRIATKYFGLRAARWFAGTKGGCDNCAGNAHTERKHL